MDRTDALNNTRLAITPSETLAVPAGRPKIFADFAVQAGKAKGAIKYVFLLYDSFVIALVEVILHL